MNSPEHTLLIVDDDVRGMAYLKGLLTSEGYRLISATDGPSALERVETESPDAVLLDVMMPGMDGFEVCRRLRNHPRFSQIPIILLTALDDRESRIEGLEAGADDFLSKPFDSAELLVRLRTISRLNRFRRMSEERARFEQVVSHAPDAIVILDREGCILLANREFARLGKLAHPDEAVGQRLGAWLSKEDERRLAEALGSVSSREPGCALEFLLCGKGHAEAEAVPVEVTVGVLPWDGGAAVQVNLRDVSEKKRLETQVLQFQRIELLGELAGGIVHDMNNVLGAVMGNLELLRRTFGDTPDFTARADVMQTSLMRGQGILRQLLAFTRGADDAMAPVDVGAVVREVRDIMYSTLKYTHELETDVPEGLPLIRGDTNQLHQILMNLCVNARDAMPEGGGLRIEGRASEVALGGDGPRWGEARACSYVVISVVDTGSGMSPEVQARIFTPFFTTKPKGKGTGLGLATVLRLVTRHGGFVTLESELGRGTRIHCHFPSLGAEVR